MAHWSVEPTQEHSMTGDIPVDVVRPNNSEIASQEQPTTEQEAWWRP